MNKLKNTILTAAAMTGYSLISPVASFAQTPTGTIDLSAPGDFSQLGGITVPSFVSGAIRLLLVAAALVFFFMLVIGGIQWILSGGDKAATESARKKITNALIGLAIVFAAWAIVALIRTLFGVDILRLDIPTFTPSS